MSQARFIKVRSKLSRIAIGTGKGITASEATKRANAALETIRVPCVQTIEDALAQIELRFGSSAPDRASEPLEDLYSLASCIIDLAGFMSKTNIDKAANALCDLVDLSVATGRTSWDAIDVNIRALQLLKTHGATLTAEKRASIISGLHSVIASRYPANETGPAGDTGPA